MPVLLGVTRLIGALNDGVLAIGRWLATLAIAVMVTVILVQVFCRYFLNNALPWPEEAARFLMLWMAGLSAPSAYRRGGFVAIDMLAEVLPRTPARLLSLALLVLSGLVLWMGIELGQKHLKAGRMFASSSLYVPMELIGQKGFKLKLIWMYASLYVGLWLLFVVNIELVLRSVVGLMGGEDRLRPLADDTLITE